MYIYINYNPSACVLYLPSHDHMRTHAGKHTHTHTHRSDDANTHIEVTIHELKATART